MDMDYPAEEVKLLNARMRAGTVLPAGDPAFALMEKVAFGQQ